MSNSFFVYPLEAGFVKQIKFTDLEHSIRRDISVGDSP